jgi:hypothetical protein
LSGGTPLEGGCPDCNGTGSWHNGLEGPNADWGDCRCVLTEIELGPEPEEDE